MSLGAFYGAKFRAGKSGILDAKLRPFYMVQAKRRDRWHLHGRHGNHIQLVCTMNCELEQRDGLWACIRCDQPPLPGPNWRRGCTSVDELRANIPTARAVVANSIAATIAEGKAIRTEDEALKLLDYCISGQCEHYDETAGCTRTGAGCQRYKHWIGRLTVSGCNLYRPSE